MRFVKVFSAALVGLFINTAAVKGEVSESTEFLTATESRLINHVLYKGKLFIDSEQFNKFATESADISNDADDGTFLPARRNGSTAWLVSSETLYIIANQSFNPGYLAEDSHP
ncbi:MAG: hypothetical protein M3Q07_03560 [Pseudobdellovibrionaceae bacterium]|nr:hypothetical protein [Pseudobdellovibrionaceae bacterium]